MTLSDHLIGCDGMSRTGGVRLDGAELLRLADACSITPRHLYQIAGGSKRASRRTAILLERASGGKVSYAEVRSESAPPKRNKRRTPMK